MTARAFIYARSNGKLTLQNRRSTTMSLARVQNFSISLDGFGTGEGQSADAPFGHAGDRLHEWMFATRWWRAMIGQPGGAGSIDDAFAQLFGPGIGAEIMGAKKFGPPGWPDCLTTCSSWWSRACPAGACAYGTDWRGSRSTTRSRPPPRLAG